MLTGGNEIIAPVSIFQRKMEREGAVPEGNCFPKSA